MLTSWSGFHYDGRTANRAVVAVAITASGLHIARDDGQSALWPFADIRRVKPLGREATRIERGSAPVETIAINEPGLPEAISQVAPGMEARLGRWAPLHDPGTHRTATRIAIAAVILFAAYFFGLPLLATSVADRVPLRWEEELGRGLADHLAPAGEACADSATTRAVAAIVNRLTAAAPPSRYTFTTRVADDSVVNAFAAPGGFVVVNRGLLEASRTPDELAGVLAHEIEHVMLHHSTRAIVRELPIQFALTAVGGSDAMAGIATRAAGTLGVLRYRRGDEAEADREGMQLIQAARLDPRAMVDFFRTLAARDSGRVRVASYFSTHPQTADRISAMQRMSESASYAPEPFSFSSDWDRLKTGCGVPHEAARPLQ